MNEETQKAWDAGYRAAEYKHAKAIELGNAILAVLDNRYEFSVGDY